jgi:hypothetical protein
MQTQQDQEPRRWLRRPRRPLRALLLLGAALAAIWVLLWGLDALGAAQLYHDARTQFAAWLQQIPRWLFVLTFIILPAFGVPLSMFYLSVGGTFGGLAPALVVAVLCMAANMALSYAMASVFVGPIRRLVLRQGYRVPELHGNAQWKVVMAVRASPLPWLMQSWLLTLGGARFSTYMLVGVPVQALVAAALVVIGDSLLSGRAGWLAVGLLAAVFVFGALRLRSGESPWRSAEQPLAPRSQKAGSSAGSSG